MRAGHGHRGRETRFRRRRKIIGQITALGPQGDTLYRHRHMVFLEFKGKRSHDMGENDRRLLQREGRADTDTRTRAEGQIGKSIDFFAPNREETGADRSYLAFPKASDAGAKPIATP